MRLITDHEVPAGVLQALAHGVVAGQLVQACDAEVVLREGVACDGGLQHVVGEDGELQVELAPQLVLPLLHQVARADYEAALEVAAGQHLLDEQARHDGLARAGVVRQNEAERHLGQHFLVHGRNLVRQRVDGGGAHGEVWVEEVR